MLGYPAADSIYLALQIQYVRYTSCTKKRWVGMLEVKRFPRATARLAALIVCLIAVGAAAHSSVTTITLTQGVSGYAGCSDTYLYESTESNYGDSSYLYVRYDANYDYDHVTLIRFDLAGQIPSGAYVKSAKLRLYQYSDHNMDASDWLKVGAYRLLKDWTEGTGGSTGATWSYRHANDTYPWLVPGARGVNSDADGDRHHTHHVTPPYAGIADSVATILDGERWVEWDVTPSVQFWASNPSKNYGLALDWWHEGAWHYDDNSGSNIRSSNYWDTSVRPQLVIVYVIPTTEPDVQLKLSDMQLSTWATDPGISFSQNSGQLLCSGTTTDTIWGMNGCATTWSMNSSFEAQIRVKLQQGIVNVNTGQFGFGMWEPATDDYVRLLAVGYSAHYYEISGTCAATGNGENHDGGSYWASYWDAVYPTYPPSCPGVRFFDETPENEAATYLTWKLRYDNTNNMFYVFVNGVLVAYYSNVDFSNWKLAIVHDNANAGVATTVWTDFPDSTPPNPNPMTWSSQPGATSTTAIAMTATTATEVQTPPCSYYFTEVSGNPGGTSSGWVANTLYTDSGLSANTQYGYKVKARDSYSTPNETTDSSTVYKYTLISAPTGVNIQSIGDTYVQVYALGSLPNLTQGQSGVQFATTGGEWTGSWIQSVMGTASPLTPNTQYSFKARARNGDAIETAWSPNSSVIRTRAALPAAGAYAPVTCQGIQANWGANGNPAGTQYYCEEITTGKNSGWINDTWWVLTGLKTQTDYHFRVKARNADLIETTWTDLGIVRTKMSIGYLKNHSGGPAVTVLEDKVVTAVFEEGRFFFVQDGLGFGLMEGISGIGVKNAPLGPKVVPGQVVTIVGEAKRNDAPYNQELIVVASDVRGGMMLPQTPIKFACSNKSSGGGDFGFQPRVIDDVTRSPVLPSYGASLVGMLVRVCGRFDDGGLGGAGYFWLDDGTGLIDESTPGTRVNLTPLGGSYPPPFPQWVAVTGIVRCVVVSGPGGDCNVRELWPLAVDAVVQ